MEERSAQHTRLRTSGPSHCATKTELRLQLGPIQHRRRTRMSGRQDPRVSLRPRFLDHRREWRRGLVQHRLMIRWRGSQLTDLLLRQALGQPWRPHSMLHYRWRTQLYHLQWLCKSARLPLPSPQLQLSPTLTDCSCFVHQFHCEADFAGHPESCSVLDTSGKTLSDDYSDDNT